MRAWYFSDESCRLGYGDGREIAVGVTHKVDCEPVLCESGLHASVRAIDALKYAPGQIIWRVELGGIVVDGDDKCVATERTYTAGGVDATETLRAFARACASDVLHLWDAPQVVVDFLATGDESIRAAAWAAAWAAARDAAEAATRDAVGDAAWAAARTAAWDAAWAADRAAVGDAAWDAAWAAALAAAWAADRAADRAAQNARLESMLEALIAENDA